MNTRVEAAFSADLDPSSVNETTFLVRTSGATVGGALTVTGAVATFTAATPLSPDQTYAVSVTSEIRDLDGVALEAPRDWSFTTEAGGAAPEPAGFMVGYGRTTTGESISATTVVPPDDTIPTGSEGTEILSLTYTAKKVGNKLRIRAGIQINPGAIGLAASAFVNDNGGPALGAAFTTVADASSVHVLLIVEAEVTAADVVTHTYRLRCGPNAAGTVYVNGSGTLRRFGGVAATFLEVTEIAQ